MMKLKDFTEQARKIQIRQEEFLGDFRRLSWGEIRNEITELTDSAFRLGLQLSGLSDEEIFSITEKNVLHD